MPVGHPGTDRPLLPAVTIASVAQVGQGMSLAQIPATYIAGTGAWTVAGAT